MGQKYRACTWHVPWTWRPLCASHKTCCKHPLTSRPEMVIHTSGFLISFTVRGPGSSGQPSLNPWCCPEQLRACRQPPSDDAWMSLSGLCVFVAPGASPAEEVAVALTANNARALGANVTLQWTDAVQIVLADNVCGQWYKVSMRQNQTQCCARSVVASRQPTSRCAAADLARGRMRHSHRQALLAGGMLPAGQAGLILTCRFGVAPVLRLCSLC